MKVQSSTLKSAMTRLKPILPSNPVVPVLASVKIEPEEDGAKLCVTNLESTCEISIPCDSPDKAFLIDFSDLFNIVKIVQSELEIELGENQAKIVSGSSSFELPIENPDDFPTTPWFESDRLTFVSGSLLKDNLSHALRFARNDDLVLNLSSVHMVFNPGGVRFEATNKNFLCKFTQELADGNMPGVALDGEALIYRNAVAQLIPSLPDSDIQIQLSEGHISFKNDGYAMIVRQIEERYPDVDAVIPEADGQKLGVDILNLVDAIKTVSVGANKDSKQIKLAAESGKMIVSAEDAMLNKSATEVIECSEDLKATFGWNYELATTALSLCPVSSDIYFQEPSRPLLIKDEVSGYISIVMPMMVDE